MNADKALSIGASIVTLAMVTVVVSHPQSAKVIKAFGNAFAGSIRAAMGK
jgi:hypothetical protein